MKDEWTGPSCEGLCADAQARVQELQVQVERRTEAVRVAEARLIAARAEGVELAVWREARQAFRLASKDLAHASLQVHSALEQATKEQARARTVQINNGPWAELWEPAFWRSGKPKPWWFILFLVWLAPFWVATLVALAVAQILGRVVVWPCRWACRWVSFLAAAFAGQ